MGYGFALKDVHVLHTQVRYLECATRAKQLLQKGRLALQVLAAATALVTMTA